MNDLAADRAAGISTENVMRHFEAGRVRAVDGVTLAIEPGAFVAICGPSGCGKTTLLNLLVAIDRPQSGSIRVAGRSLTEMGQREADAFRRHTVGLVFQFHNLLANLTALENVQAPMLPDGPSPRERLKRACALLEQVGLEGRMHARPPTLSGGERQRVALARALANEPRVLLADEPTGNLDSSSGERLLDLLGELQRDRGTTLVVVTHDPTVAARADRVLHMLDGRITG
jgi:putative ABC transport system ATP-binding protein